MVNARETRDWGCLSLEPSLIPYLPSSSTMHGASWLASTPTRLDQRLRVLAVDTLKSGRCPIEWTDARKCGRSQGAKAEVEIQIYVVAEARAKGEVSASVSIVAVAAL